MEIAFVFSGEIRFLKDNKDYLLDLKNKYNADVFASFWEPDNIEDSELFVKTFNPIRYELENKNIFYNTIDQLMNDIDVPYGFIWDDECDRIKNGNLFFMTYKMWKSNSLTKTVGKEYDIVVRMRTDISLDSNFKFELNNYFNVPKMIVYINSIPNNWGFSDTFSYSKPEIMDYYSSAMFHIISYIKEGCFIWTVENILRYHLNQKNNEGKITINPYVDVNRDSEVITELFPITEKFDDKFYSYNNTGNIFKKKD